MNERITFDFYGDVKGRKSGTWITEAGRSVGLGTTDLIESPGYVIESLLRDVLGIATADINIASFDVLGNTTNGVRKDWKYARSIIEQRYSQDYIREVAQEAGLLYCKDYQNKETLIALDRYAPVLQINASHIREENKLQQIRLRRTHIKYIHNEFYLNYKLNYATNNFDKQVFINASATNMASNVRSDKSPLNTYTGLCSTSQTRYSKVQRLTMDARNIRDDATAELLIKFLADWLALRRWQIEATLLYSTDTLKLEIGDQVTFNHALLPVSARDIEVQGVSAVPSTTGGSLPDGTRYYVVTAIDPYGETKKSAEVSATITGGGGAGKVTVSWTAVTGATGYRVYFGTISETEGTYFETAGTSYVDTGAAGTLGSPPTGAPVFFVTRQVNYNFSAPRFSMSFLACPMVPTLAGGYGYNYGSNYGGGI